MKLLSKFAMGVSPSNSTLAYVWRMLRLCFLRREVVLLLIYINVMGMWKHQRGLGVSCVSADGRLPWYNIFGSSAIYAIQGRRKSMEDRYVINENIENSGISFVAVFDGHGGQLSVNFAKQKLVPNLCKKLVEASNIVRANSLATASSTNNDISKSTNDADHPSASTAQGQSSFKKPQNSADVSTAPEANQNLKKLWNALIESLTSLSYGYISQPQTHEAKYYVDAGNNIDFDKLITDEILAADKELLKILLELENVSGSTALIAVLHGTKLTVANVGDSRGVMCDSEGKTIPLSYDHKPDVKEERKRIEKAGGFVTFEDVPRVDGCLAMSRALGDVLLKDNNKVIAKPEILLFDLAEYKPKFLILASDGLWDVFSNEEAVEFIEKHLHEADFGAMSLTLAAYDRGSTDNITVTVVAFKNGKYQIN